MTDAQLTAQALQVLIVVGEAVVYGLFFYIGFQLADLFL